MELPDFLPHHLCRYAKLQQCRVISKANQNSLNKHLNAPVQIHYFLFKLLLCLSRCQRLVATMQFLARRMISMCALVLHNLITTATDALCGAHSNTRTNSNVLSNRSTPTR